MRLSQLGECAFAEFCWDNFDVRPIIVVRLLHLPYIVAGLAYL